MAMYRTRWGIVHSDAVCQKDASWQASTFTKGVFHGRGVLRRVIRAYAASERLSVFPVLLIRHGFCYEGDWLCAHEGFVQNWINTNDGTTSVLMISSCNAHNVHVRSKRSLLIHLNCEASFWDMFRQRRILRLYHPAMGYIEGDRYRIRKVLGK